MLPRFLLLIATATGCSGALPIAPAPEANKPAAVLAVGSYKLTVSTTHEISCSMSFQTDTEYSTHELAIAADGAASLTVKTRTRSVFGPSDAKFKGGGSTSKDIAREAKYACHAQVIDGVTQVDCVEQTKSSKIKLVCRPTSVEVTEGAKKLRVDAISCSGLPWLPSDATSYFKGRAPLGVGAGVLLDVDDYGYGGEHIALRKGI